MIHWQLEQNFYRHKNTKHHWFIREATMTLDMWLKEDIRNVLLGIDLACAHMAVERGDAEAIAFREGFQAALSSVALSLGISPMDRSSVRLRVSRPPVRQLTDRGY
jgi:hypothetical protein